MRRQHIYKTCESSHRLRQTPRNLHILSCIAMNHLNIHWGNAHTVTINVWTVSALFERTLAHRYILNKEKNFTVFTPATIN